MKRLSLGLLTCALLFTGAASTGCGEDPPAEPGQVIERAMDDLSSTGAGARGPSAEVEVASLGFEDQPLQTRILAVNPGTYAAIREAITGPEPDDEAGTGAGEGGGLIGLAGDIESQGTEEIDGIEVDHVSGTFDVENLIGSLSGAIESGGVAGDAGLPGLGDLEQLRETLTEATFDLYAATEDGSFERLDLTLSLDDRENALPPTRIRFSLTETDPTEAAP